MIIFILLIFILFISFGLKEKYKNIHYVKIKQIFKNSKEKQNGLMFKPYIDKDIGYMFYYRIPKKVNFWMKNTYIPLDIILIDFNNKIIGLLENMEPLSLKKRYIDKKIKYAIEINSGFVKKKNIKKGDIIKFIYL